MAFGAGAVGAVAVGAFASPAVASGAPAVLPVALPAFTPAPAAELPIRSHFAGYEGETFVATASDVALALTLAEIDDVPPAIGTDDENRFNLIFTVQGSAQAAPGVYEITHPSVPAALLFASPVGATKRRQLQALVNRTA